MKRSALLVSMFCLTGCQSAPTPSEMTDGPALLESETDIPALISAMQTALGKAIIELGADSPVTSSKFTILPAQRGPFETNSPAMPTVYSLFLADDICFAIEDKTGDSITLDGVSCVSAP